jgi:addiction module HigA family antidote
VKKKIRLIHPGEILREEFLVPMKLNSNLLAQAIGVPPNRVSLIVTGGRGITADTALRLSKAFGTTSEFWMNMQQAYDLRVAELDENTAAEIRKIRRIVI